MAVGYERIKKNNKYNLRTAVLISGYLRTFKINLTSLQEKIIDKFENVDIYIHITDNEENDDKYLNINNDIKFITDNLNPVFLTHETNLKISNNKKENDLLNTWIKYYKLNQIKKINETIFGKYDMVIKYRPDLNIISDLEFNNDKIYIPNDSKIDKSKLDNINDPYICDTLAYGSSDQMDKYFDFYLSIKDLILKNGYTPETLLYHYLKNNNIEYQLCDIDYNIILSMCNVFAIAGDSGSGKTTLGDLLKKYFSNSFMFECDRYHKWERGNENWNKITHLNPNANYIAKMSEDIFDLKVGKTVYQVNYDHDTGQFTEKEEIEKSDNLIVCGLHSLYSHNSEVYNLKIFMDTDIKLKTKWKIDRDTSKRGYSISKIMKQIEDRKEDYLKFIYPQRDKSDIIINFTLNDDDEINLTIFFNKKLNISKLINNLIKYNIDIDFKEDLNFNKIKFSEYKYCELFERTKLNSFYDYIIYLILNIQNK
jgi:uridine kinase